MVFHLIFFQMYALAMSGNNPIETISCKLLHRTGLFGPGVPADTSRSNKRFPVSAPPQMVSGEEIAILEKQNAMSSGMPGSGDDKKILPERDRINPLNR